MGVFCSKEGNDTDSPNSDDEGATSPHLQIVDYTSGAVIVAHGQEDGSFLNYEQDVAIDNSASHFQFMSNKNIYHPQSGLYVASESGDVDPGLNLALKRITPGPRYAFVFDPKSQHLTHERSGRVIQPAENSVHHGARLVVDDDMTGTNSGFVDCRFVTRVVPSHIIAKCEKEDALLKEEAKLVASSDGKRAREDKLGVTAAKEDNRLSGITVSEASEAYLTPQRRMRISTFGNPVKNLSCKSGLSLTPVCEEDEMWSIFPADPPVYGSDPNLMSCVRVYIQNNQGANLAVNGNMQLCYHPTEGALWNILNAGTPKMFIVNTHYPVCLGVTAGMLRLEPTNINIIEGMYWTIYTV